MESTSDLPCAFNANMAVPEQERRAVVETIDGVEVSQATAVVDRMVLVRLILDDDNALEAQVWSSPRPGSM